MNKVLFSVLIFLSGISLGQAQEADRTTNIVREDWKAKDDIEILKDKYDIEQVAMDEVYVIRNNKMEKTKTPKALNVNDSNARTSTKAGSAKETTKTTKSAASKSKSKKKRKVFKKRLKNRKFKKYTGRSCFRF